MATVDRFHRLIADYVHSHEHAAWWEVIAYSIAALLLGLAVASAFTFVVPRMLPSF
jgi:hypothetical protein